MDKFFSSSKKKGLDVPSSDAVANKRIRLRQNKSTAHPGTNQQVLHMIDHHTLAAAKEKKKLLGERFVAKREDPAFMSELFTAYKKEMLSAKEISDRSILNVNCVQSVSFSPSFDESSVRAICIPKETAVAIKNGERVYLRGSKSQQLVFCTENKTFEVQMNQLSSTMLLSGCRSGETQSENAVGPLVTVLSSVNPDVCLVNEMDNLDTTQLRDMLQEKELYWDDEQQFEHPAKSYSMSDILRTIQMSEGQIRNYIKRHPVIEIDGKFVWMSCQYQNNTLGKIVDLLDDTHFPDIEINNTSFVSLRRALPSTVHDNAIRWFLDHLFEQKEDGSFHINPKSITQLRARHLLQAKSGIKLSKFEELMEEMLPHGVQYRRENLGGIALTSSHASGESHVILLDKDELPDEHYARVREMFSAKSLWTRQEIEPYLVDVFPSKWHMEEFLYECLERGDNGQGDTVYGGVIDPDCDTSTKL